MDPDAFMIVDDLPSGPVFSFIMTAFVSYFFQFAGFVLTYLLHTTHAAKYGSRAGLGATLIQYGLIQYSGSYRNAAPVDEAVLAEQIAMWNNSTVKVLNVTANTPLTSLYNATDPNSILDMEMQFAVSSRDWIALILMTLGAS